MAKKGWHLISTYSISADTITCICGWHGHAGAAWNQHKIDRKNDPAPVGFNSKNHAYGALVSRHPPIVRRSSPKTVE